LEENVRALPDEEMSFSQLALFSQKLKAVRLSLKKLNAPLDARFNAMKREKRDRRTVVKKSGEIVWKEDLGGSYRWRDLVGGKGAWSSEIAVALERLSASGRLPPGIRVTNPRGFLVQQSDYDRWDRNGRNPDIADDMRTKLARAYVKLIGQQAEALAASLSPGQVREFLEETVRKLGACTPAGTGQALDDMYKRLDEVLSLHMPESLRRELVMLGRVAVRSSDSEEDTTEQAAAGKFRTVLNVRGLDRLFQAVVDVWGSGARSLLVDELVDSQVSVLMFSADPVDKRFDRMRLSVVKGAAAGLVDGVVRDPDGYLIHRDGTVPLSIEELHVGKKEEEVHFDWQNGGLKPPVTVPAAVSAALSDDKVLAIARAGIELSQALGFEADFELTINGAGDIVFLQARPITSFVATIKEGKKLVKLSKDYAMPTVATGLPEAVPGGIDLGPDKIGLEIGNEGKVFGPP